MASDRQAQGDEQASFIDVLRQRLRATVVETHISWVLLDGTHAWKIKKPLKLAFLDASDLDTRRQWCEAEVNLNRRLAPDLYLGVVPIYGSRFLPNLVGQGPVIDYMVQMRQFPADALLSHRIGEGQIDPAWLDDWASDLARFHAEAPCAPAGSSWGSEACIAAAMQGVLDGLAAHASVPVAALQGLRAWAADQAVTLAPLWRARQHQGRVVEAHGDLHLDNVLLWQGRVTAFDCIEFDPALRWIDALSDAAFFTMDLAAHDRGDLAWRFLNAYLDASGDHAGLPVLRHQLVYRALIRALVARLRAQQTHADRAQPSGPDYLGLALRWAGLTAASTAPQLAITHGVSGSGKTVAAGHWSVRHEAIRLRSDVERQRLFGSGAYAPEQTQRVYERLWFLADQALAAGWSVVVDATFLARAQRQRFHMLAQAHRVPFQILHCEAPDAVLQQRIRQRQALGRDASEADLAVLAHQQGTAEPLTPQELRDTLWAPPHQP